jgi:hypothetical protein
MGIYAKVKYNNPEELFGAGNVVFHQVTDDGKTAAFCGSRIGY